MTGQPSQRRRKPYSRASIDRALTHHERTGLIHLASPPDAPGQRRTQTKFRIRFHNGAELELSERETYHVCVALAAAVTHESRMAASEHHADAMLPGDGDVDGNPDPETVDLIVRLTPRDGSGFTPVEMDGITEAVSSAVDDVLFTRTRVHRWSVLQDRSGA